MTITRRNLTRGALWSAPAILATSTIPAYAASVTLGSTPIYTSTGVSDFILPTGARNYYTGTQLCEDADITCRTRAARIRSIAVNGSTFTVGYGDWDANVDSFGDQRIEVRSFATDTGAQLSATALGSEAVDNMRLIGDKIYSPTIDPSDKIAFGQSRNNIPGYAITDMAGKTVFQPLKIRTEHVFDMNRNPVDGHLYVAYTDYHKAHIAKVLNPANTSAYRHGEAMEAADVEIVYSLHYPNQFPRMTSIAFDGTGQLYVLISDVGRVVKPITDRRSRIAPGHNATGPLVSLSDGRVLFSNPYSDPVIVTADNKTEYINIGNVAAYGIDSSGATYLDSAGTVHRLDASGHQVIGEIPETGATAIALAGDKLLTGHADGGVKAWAL